MSVFSTFCRRCPRGLLAPRLLRAALLATLLALLTGCGGAQGTSSRSADDADGSDEGGSLGGSADDAAGDANAGPQGPDCSDGTCFVCGDGMCPVGFFCDEQASGGPACSWLPECADTASCSCVLGVLGSSCSCSDESGGPHLSCD